MRRTGGDPATVAWSAVEVDELAIACLAVNVYLWNLGLHVLPGVGNALTDDWRARAAGERAECLQLARQIRHYKSALQLLDHTPQLLHHAAGDSLVLRHDSS